MLPNVANGTARRCQARARSTGEQCKKLAVGSCRTCASHGGIRRCDEAVRIGTIRGQDKPCLSGLSAMRWRFSSMK